MYRNCIFCSAALGANESIERFPVGKTLAFDAAKGRLWAVCPKCARWNLAPIEERWEAIEDAEQLFRDARMRVHGENVGLARLRDGGRLIRIGQALAGELAAWRYGRELRRRRFRAALGDNTVRFGGSGAMFVGGIVALPLMVATSVLFTAGGVYRYVQRHRRADQVLHRVAGEDSPTGHALHVRWRDLALARMRPGPDRRLAVSLAQTREGWAGAGRIVLTGPAATALVGKALVQINGYGARQADLDVALDRIADRGGPERFVRRVAREEYGLEVPGVEYGDLIPTLGLRRKTPERIREGRARRPFPLNADYATSLALEMALHEESERRAMEGDLAELHAAWREAEEIAAIADRLPDALDEEVR
jgi:hypothetical protein